MAECLDFNKMIRVSQIINAQIDVLCENFLQVDWLE